MSTLLALVWWRRGCGRGSPHVVSVEVVSVEVKFYVVEGGGAFQFKGLQFAFK
jgi:hypothetical protein